MLSKTTTTATKEGAKPALVPKLRFPEFRGTEAWHLTTLDSVCEVLNNRRRPITGNDRTPGPYPYYGASGIVDYVGGFIFDERLLLVGEDGAKWGAFEKTAFIAEGKYWVNNHAHVLKPFAANDTLLENYLTMQDLSPFVTGAAPPKLTLGKLKGIPVPLPPSPAEQQKIAEFLSSVDGLMAAQARKVDALKTHKKGLMQQLFPREGETQPRLRFPEFETVGEWREGRLADIATVLQGYGFPERHQGQKSGDYPFYKVSDISRSLASGKVFIEESANYINESLLKELRAKPIPEGTTVFAKIGEAIRSNRRAITTVPCLIDNNAAGVKRIRGKATDMFIYLLMEQISLIDHAGGVVPAVNKSAIEEIAVKFPEPDEQECIASCMSSLDALITAETQKLEAIKIHKKGLMQQLFPFPEEVEA